jgi:PiT family inorganic phosphate transporter
LLLQNEVNIAGIAKAKKFFTFLLFYFLKRIGCNRRTYWLLREDGNMLWDIIALLVICVAFIFLLTNGLHDASSVVATMISCGAAQPFHAVAFAGVLELLGAVFGGSAVAYTVAKMIKVAPGHMLLLLLFVALAAATTWNLLTWRIGLPSSSTHALIGGLVGAVCIATGPDDVVWGIKELAEGQLTGVAKVVAGLMLSPIAGFIVA